MVPAHVAHEYCRPDRSFDPTPSFTEPTLPRVLTFENWSSGSKVMGVWFPLDGSLGSSFAVLRAGCRWVVSDMVQGTLSSGSTDLSALAALFKTRTTQYATLQKTLDL